MTETKKYWLGDAEDTYAVVAGADERDRLIPLGWSVVDEPTEGWVHIWHEGIEQPGKPVPVAALRDLWGPIGWVAGPPPGGIHPFAPEPPAEQVAEAEKKADSKASEKAAESSDKPKANAGKNT